METKPVTLAMRQLVRVGWFPGQTRDDTLLTRALITNFVGLIMTELVPILLTVSILIVTEYRDLVSNFVWRDLYHSKRRDEIMISSLKKFWDYNSGADKTLNAKNSTKIIKP